MGFSDMEKRTITKIFSSLINVITWIGYTALAGAVLATTTNVIGRYILNRPLLGEVDFVEVCMAVFGGIAIFLTTIHRHHVSVDVLVIRFSKRTQMIISRIALLMGFVTWGFLAVLAFIQGIELIDRGDRTDVLYIRHAPFAIILAVGLFMTCITMLKQALHPRASEDKKD